MRERAVRMVTQHRIEYPSEWISLRVGDVFVATHLRCPERRSGVTLSARNLATRLLLLACQSRSLFVRDPPEAGFVVLGINQKHAESNGLSYLEGFKHEVF